MTAQSLDVVVIGAGAAGMMCAVEAGRRGRRVLILDHAKAPGEKIRISGGGRCNFTNIHAGPQAFLSQNPRFAISALKRYTPKDFTELWSDRTRYATWLEIELCACEALEVAGHVPRGTAERIRGMIAAVPIHLADGISLPVTVSVGVASLGTHCVTAEALLRIADEALYRAKHGGRNRVEIGNRLDVGDPVPRG